MRGQFENTVGSEYGTVVLWSPVELFYHSKILVAHFELHNL